MASKKPSKSDYKRMSRIHPDLVAWAEDCFARFARSKRFPRCRLRVLEGRRTKARQKHYIKIGSSWTMDSKHLTGHAVDIIIQVRGPDGRWMARWEVQMYGRFAKLIGKPAAKKMGLVIDWGGDWEPVMIDGELQSRFDGPHWEIDPEVYLT